MKELSECSVAWRKLQLSRAKLKISTKNSALLAGFAMIAMVELQLNDEEDNPIPLAMLIFFGVTTTLLIAVHLSALMISSCILPHIDAIALCEERDLDSINDSPHEAMHMFIEVSWIFSNILGIVLFLTEIGALCWVKFWELGTPKGRPGKETAVAASVVLVLAIGFLIFYAFYFYKQLADHNFERSKLRVKDLESSFQVNLRKASSLGEKRRPSIWMMARKSIWKSGSDHKTKTVPASKAVVEERF